MIGERLRQLRKARHLTQVQLAKASGAAQNYISKIENGVTHNPARAKTGLLARALDVAEAELLAPLVRRPTGQRCFTLLTCAACPGTLAGLA